MSFEVFSFPFRVLLACLRIRKSWGGAKCTSSLFFATWRLLWAHMKCALELLWQLVWAKNDRRRSGKARRMAAAVNVMQIDARLLPRPRLPTACPVGQHIANKTNDFPLLPKVFSGGSFCGGFSCIWDTRPLKLIPQTISFTVYVRGKLSSNKESNYPQTWKY